MERLVDTAARLIARIASEQHGVITRAQLLSIGLSDGAIQNRLGKGTLIRIHRGVYRVGHTAPSREADCLAAVLACGETAVLSGRAAAHLFGLVKGPAPAPEVTCSLGRVVEGVITRRTRGMDERDITTWNRIRVTTVARTVVDLAGVVSGAALARAVHEAGLRHGCTPDEIEAVLDRRPNSTGARVLRSILRGDVHLTLSSLERRFLKLLRQARIPLPDTNIRAGGRLVDCRWPEHRLTVELDGYRYHASRHAFEQDRRRERQAYARGDQFRRYTWGDVVERPAPVIAELRAVFTGAASSGTSIRVAS